MNYLLDTHILLWLLYEPPKIPKSIRLILEDEEDVKYVSGVSLWEISLKYSLGKLDLGDSTPSEIFDYLPDDGLEIIDLNSDLLATYYQLAKKETHRDPFDRLLVWQAISEGYTLLSVDSSFQQYLEDGLKLVQ